jgi:hypothetical protein
MIFAVSGTFQQFNENLATIPLKNFRVEADTVAWRKSAQALHPKRRIFIEFPQTLGRLRKLARFVDRKKQALCQTRLLRKKG